MTRTSPRVCMVIACAAAILAHSAQGAAQPKPADLIAMARAIVIVPMESPPLSFGPGVDVGAALAANTGTALSYVADAGVAQAGRMLFAVSGIVMLASMPAAMRGSAKVAEVAEGVLSAAGTWVPTVALAAEAQGLLHRAGVENVRVSECVRTIPGIEKRERTFTMHNWYGPINAWFRSGRTPFAYAAPEVMAGELVLEIGLANFELGPGRILYLLVSAKLVDPATGKVLSSARKFVYPETADPGTLFEGDASRFKGAFAAAGRKALESDLRKTGFAVP